jgi:hypothetical protein
MISLKSPLAGLFFFLNIIMIVSAIKPIKFAAATKNP